MRRRAILLTAAVVLLAAAAAALRSIRTDEPRYQGRTLAEWITVLDENHNSNPTGAAEARAALVALGTNNLKNSVCWMSYDERMNFGKRLSSALPANIRSSRFV
jgi:hypothetical protein